MKVGDTVESAIWLDGEESLEDRQRFEHDVTQSIETVCRDEGVLHGPVRFIEKRPGEDRVPEVPDHVQGQRVRLLVGEAEIVAKRPEIKPDSFIANLDRMDLLRLRNLTRDAHRRQSNTGLSDTECDQIIEQYGPEAALETLRKGVRH